MSTGLSYLPGTIYFCHINNSCFVLLAVDMNPGRVEERSRFLRARLDSTATRTPVSRPAGSSWDFLIWESMRFILYWLQYNGSRFFLVFPANKCQPVLCIIFLFSSQLFSYCRYGLLSGSRMFQLSQTRPDSTATHTPVYQRLAPAGVSYFNEACVLH